MPSTYELASGRKIEGFDSDDVAVALLVFLAQSSPYSGDETANMDAMALAIGAALEHRRIRERLAASIAESGQDVPAVEGGHANG